MGIAEVSGYAVARLWDVAMGAEVVEYLHRIDATLAPYGGSFLIHGGDGEVLEGAWTGDLVVIAFPSRERARQWYRSPDYQAILPLRTGSAKADIALFDGVGPDHRAPDVLN